MFPFLNLLEFSAVGLLTSVLDFVGNAEAIAAGVIQTSCRHRAARYAHMFDVACGAERLGATLAILRVMPTDFAAAPGAVSQMGTRTSGDTAIPRRAR